MRYIPTTPKNVSDEDTAFAEWVKSELDKIASAFVEQDIVYLRVLHVEPTKPREGMIVRADGTDWNPGAGAGIYTYLTGSWSKL